jgi:hypothetical protein
MYAARRDGRFDEAEVPFEVSGEGGATMGLYSAQRTTLCADGKERVFRRHGWVSRAWRMYFEPDPISNKIHVGPIGPHPQTATGYS